MQGKQAKIVSPTQERAILGYLVTTRYPARDRVMFLLSMKAGLRAKEMASLTWAMVTSATCPWASVTMAQVSEAISLARRPAFIDKRNMTRSRSWVGLTILACLPCMGTLQSTEACYSY